MTTAIRVGKAVAGESPHHLFCIRGPRHSLLLICAAGLGDGWEGRGRGLAHTSHCESHASVSDNTIPLGFGGASKAVEWSQNHLLLKSVLSLSLTDFSFLNSLNKVHAMAGIALTRAMCPSLTQSLR